MLHVIESLSVCCRQTGSDICASLVIAAHRAEGSITIVSAAAVLQDKIIINKIFLCPESKGRHLCIVEVSCVIICSFTFTNFSLNSKKNSKESITVFPRFGKYICKSKYYLLWNFKSIPKYLLGFFRYSL